MDISSFQQKISQQGSVKIEPQDIPLEVAYEDDDLLIINKQEGLMVHPTANQTKDTLINALLFRKTPLSKGENEYRPGIVHRFLVFPSFISELTKKPLDFY
jgi:23S rRNA pseudouridine1911/1915/1917 synthase